MTHVPAPAFLQSLIVLSNARKEMLAAAIKNAHKALQITVQTEWPQPLPYGRGSENIGPEPRP